MHENLNSTNDSPTLSVVLSADRCHTVGVSGDRSWSKAKLEAALARAAKEGHELVVDLERVKITKHGYGYAVRCTCGWQSTPTTKRIKAFSKGWIHVGDVLGEALYDDWAGGVGASPDRPERLGDGAERSRPGGEGEPSSPDQPPVPVTVGAASHAVDDTPSSASS